MASSSTDNKVIIQISAQDLATTIINNINISIHNMNNSLRETRETTDRVTSGFDSMLDPLYKIPLAFNQILSAIGSVSSALMGLLDPVMQMDVINIQLKAAAGSATLAAKDLDWLKRVSNDLGLSLKETAQGFGFFANATRDTVFEGSEARKLFESLQKGLVAMHLPADTAQRIFVQLSQAIGKNQVTMADWRPILEAMPALNEQFAKSLGLSTPEFMKMRENSEITNTELLKLAETLEKTFSEDAKHAAHSLQAEINRLKTAVFLTSVEFGEMIKPEVTTAVRYMTQNMKELVEAAKAFIVVGLSAAIGRSVAAMVAYTKAQYAALVAKREAVAMEYAHTEAIAMNTAMKERDAIATLRQAEAEFAMAQRNAATATARVQQLRAAGVATQQLTWAQQTQTRAFLVQHAAEESLLAARAASAAAATASAAATNALAAANARLTLTARAAAAATTAFNSVVGFLGGPVSAAIILFSALAYGVYKLTQSFKENSEEIDKNKEKEAEAAEAAREAIAKRKAISDGYYATVGSDLEKNLAKAKTTYEKETEIVKKEMAARRKEAKYDSLKLEEINRQEKAAMEKVNAAYAESVRKARADDRQDAVKNASDMLAMSKEYYEQRGDIHAVNSIKYKESLSKDLQAVNSHYDRLEAEAAAKGVKLHRIQKQRDDAILAVKKQHSRDAELVDIEMHTAALKLQKEADASLITEIKNKIALHVISENDGNNQILQIQKSTTEAMLSDARERAEILKTVKPNSPEYKAAVKEVQKLESELSGHVMTEIKNRETATKAAVEKQVATAKAAYQEDLNAVTAAENSKSITTEQAAIRRLQIERDYAAQMAEIKAQELAAFNPETQAAEYQKALAAKLDADKTYLAAKQKLNTEEAAQLSAVTAKHAEEIKSRIEADKAALVQSQAFASSWFGSWDAAYNNASASLANLSDAAYNAFAELQDLPLKTANNLDTLRKKADEAATSYGKLYRTATDAGLAVGGAWGDAYKSLAMIPAEAARISSEFYRQKVAATELAEALAKPANATGQFAANAEEALKNMNLLDNASLDNLKSGIDKIKNAMISFTDKIREAIKSLQDEFDNLTLSKIQLEEKRYNEEKLKWQEDYRTAQEQGNAEAKKALQEQLDLIEKIHKINLANLAADKSNYVAPKIPGMATGGKVGGMGTGDNQLRWLDPREWVINPHAVSVFGDGVMSAINNPFSSAGRELMNRIHGLSLPSVSINAPRLAMATGGQVGELSAMGNTINLTINTTQPVDDTFIRRKIIPELERYSKLRA